MFVKVSYFKDLGELQSFINLDRLDTKKCIPYGVISNMEHKTAGLENDVQSSMLMYAHISPPSANISVPKKTSENVQSSKKNQTNH